MTIKPLVELLEVKRKKRALPTVSAEIHGRVRNFVYRYIYMYVTNYCRYSSRFRYLGSDMTY